MINPHILRLVFLIVLVISCSEGFAQNIEVSGNVSGNWSADTVKVTGHISVPSNQTLTIEGGTIVEFQGYYHLEVKGTLQALGAPSLPIVFTVNDTLGLHNINVSDGAWRGIVIDNDGEGTDPQAFFSHCHFEYAKTYQSDQMQHGGAVFIRDASNISFDGCSFFRNHSYLSGGAIYFFGSSPQIVNCSFVENKAGHLPINNELYGYGGGVCGLRTSSVIRNNVFSNNWASGLGGGMSIDMGNPVIENNIFDGNDGPLGGGFGILRSNLEHTISNNLVTNNFSLFFGGGIAFIETNANASNNTFFGNLCPGAGGGALYFNVESKVGLYNNIFWQNQASVGNLAFVFDTSSPSFYHNNIQGGYATIQGGGNYEFENNIDNDPLFVGTGNHPFSLSSNSPCINSGIPDHLFLALPETDLAGNPRVQLGTVDMGAYEAAVSTVGIVGYMEPNASLEVFPNPARTHINIIIDHSKESNNTKLTLVNSKGQVVLDVYSGNLSVGKHNFFVDFTSAALEKGLYFVVAEMGESRTVERVVVF